MFVKNDWRGQWQGHTSRQTSAKRMAPSCKLRDWESILGNNDYK